MFFRFILFLALSLSELPASPVHYLREYFKDEIQFTVLQGGLSGAKNYKVTVGDRHYVLRVLNPAASLEARRQEIASATYAGERNIGPPIYYVDPNENAFIMEFVQGETLTTSFLNDQENLSLLLKTLRALHQSTGNFPRGWTIFERIKLQLEHLKKSAIPYPIQAVDEALAKLQSIESQLINEPLVPCHNDLSALNVIANDREVKFIDWTDSGMGHFYNDLGYFVLVNCIDEDRYWKILELYFERPPTEEELSLLMLMKKVNMLRIFASNFPAYQPAIPDPQKRALRTSQLEERLQDHELFPPEYFFDLHMNGKLKGSETIIDFSLSSLKSFISN